MLRGSRHRPPRDRGARPGQTCENRSGSERGPPDAGRAAGEGQAQKHSSPDPELDRSATSEAGSARASAPMVTAVTFLEGPDARLRSELEPPVDLIDVARRRYIDGVHAARVTALVAAADALQVAPVGLE